MNISELFFLNELAIITGFLILSGSVYATVVSVYENEKPAARRFLIYGTLLSLPYFFAPFIDFELWSIVVIILLSFPLIIFMLYFLPIRSRNAYTNPLPSGNIDERDIMFSRNELKSDTEEFNEYYRKNPSKKILDDEFRKNPGLLSTNSAAYHPLMFNSAHASFYAICALKNNVDGEVASDRLSFSEDEMTNYIKNWSVKLGALDVGITQLKDYHKYSIRGRKGNYGDKVELNHKYAIAFTVEMDFDNVRSGPMAPIVMESAQQYLESGAIAVQVAEFIRSLGYPARAHIDGNYQVVCPLVAKDAGLGEIGRMGLLMTPNQGPRVRIGVVTTDLPLLEDETGYDPSVIEFCTMCKKCAHNCPSNSISIIDREEIDGVLRWQIDQESCFTLWTKTGTDCGRCMSVCPYSHPDNLLHNIVRYGIKNSSVFSKIALKMDDYFYGKHPEVHNPKKWMDIHQIQSKN